jgi:hypothetical protein
LSNAAEGCQAKRDIQLKEEILLQISCRWRDDEMPPQSSREFDVEDAALPIGRRFASSAPA